MPSLCMGLQNTTLLVLDVQRKARRSSRERAGLFLDYEKLTFEDMRLQ